MTNTRNIRELNPCWYKEDWLKKHFRNVFRTQTKMEFIREITIFTICSILDVCTEFWIRFWKTQLPHALIHLTDKIRQQLDKWNFACGIFIDFQKAFDTVDHQILVQKLMAEEELQIIGFLLTFKIELNLSL